MDLNNLLQGKGLLTRIQKSFLALFTEVPDQEQFFLTGGTALAEYYLGHRLSFDLDFFTGTDGLVIPTSYQIERLGNQHGFDIKVIRRFNTFVEFLVTLGEEQLKIDLALDSPFRFEPTVKSADGIYVNNRKDIQVDKLLAFYGRAEPRDAVDLYFIMQQASIDELMHLAEEKDPALTYIGFRWRSIGPLIFRTKWSDGRLKCSCSLTLCN